MDYNKYIIKESSVGLMIDELLEKYDMTRSQVAKISGVNKQTLAEANKNDDVSSWKVKTIMALAMAIGKTPGEVIDELLKQIGNPIINFIRKHPYMDRQLVEELEDTIIRLHEKNINLKNVSFNRYYEGDDTNENAEVAMRNTLKTLKQIEKDIG